MTAVVEQRTWRRMCVVGPGRHAPVLGTITEHLIHSLSKAWEITSIQLAVPDDEYDWTLIGLTTPALVEVPSIIETEAQTNIGRRRRARRFFFRHRPDVVLLDWWSIRQCGALVEIAAAAHDADAKVALRCCGRLDAGKGLAARVAVRRLVSSVDLLVTQGWVPSAIPSNRGETWSLPEWKTEERQADPQIVEVVCFLPPEDLTLVELLLRSIDGLSESRVGQYRLHLVIRGGGNSRLARLVASHHHASRLTVIREQLTDFQLERWIRDADVAVIFEPDWSSRAFEAAERQGIPIVVVRSQGWTGRGDDYCGAALSPIDPASILGAIERANLARKFRYPSSERWVVGVHRLTSRLATLLTDSAHE